MQRDMVNEIKQDYKDYKWKKRQDYSFLENKKTLYAVESGYLEAGVSREQLHQNKY